MKKINLISVFGYIIELILILILILLSFIFIEISISVQMPLILVYIMFDICLLYECIYFSCRFIKRIKNNGK